MRAFWLRTTRICFAIAEDGGGGGGGGNAPIDVPGFGQLEPALAKVVTDNGWKAPVDSVKNYAGLVTKMGTMISIPGEKATPEEITAFNAKLGVPASADRYDLGDWKKPEGVAWDDGAQTAILGELHKAGATPKVVQTAFKAYSAWAEGMAKARDTHAATVAAAALPALQKEWGDQHQAKYDAANLAVSKVFGTDLEAAKKIRLEDGSFLLDNIPLAKAFAAVGATMTEDGDLAGKGAGGGELGEIKTPQAAEAEIQKIRAAAVNDPKHPYNDRRHPDYAKTQKRMNDLYALKNSGRPAVVD